MKYALVYDSGAPIVSERMTSGYQNDLHAFSHFGMLVQSGLLKPAFTVHVFNLTSKCYVCSFTTKGEIIHAFAPNADAHDYCFCTDYVRTLV